ncbi:hypothetical protein N431DRAFT_486396 [Stipitochalara longipes BDJ]|nr:hypothetical protein N431DRAFT_486396 [Stipitochalara longipes BDJ]
MSRNAQKRVIGRHACEGCRKAKIRCLTDTLETDAKCRKCLVGGLDCEWKEISKTRTRRKTSARVADLENQLSSLTAAFDGLRNGTSPGGASHDEMESELQMSSATPPNNDHTTATTSDGTLHTSTPPAPNPHDPSFNRILSELSSKVLPFNSFSAETRAQLVETFVTRMLPQYPVISIPGEIPLEQLEKLKPFMVNAVITTACSISQPRLFRAMHDKNIALLSQTIVVEGRKSMDLLQALLITSTWACPPDDLSNLNVYQWSHMAGTMALELGLGGRTSLHAQAQSVQDFATNSSLAIMERYRTMFGVYLTCSRLAVSFRRQRMISFSSSTDSIIELFLRSSQNINDRRLLAWLRLQSIAEDIESMKQNAEMRLDQSFLETTSIKNGFSLFHDRLKSWENELDPVLWIESLRIDYGLCRSKLHELTVYYGENIHQLDLPALADQSRGMADNPQGIMSPRYIQALFSFIEGCQSILEVFLHADIETIRVLPLLTMFRAPFAFKALSMLKKRMENPVETINLLIDDQTLAWDVYNGSISKLFETASANKLYAYPSMALQIRDSILKSKRSDHERYGFQNFRNTGTTTEQHGTSDIIVSDTMLEDNYELINHLTMPFYSGQDESAAWPMDFVDFGFYSL